MALQRNVQQQAADARAAIQCALRVGVVSPAWLLSVLERCTLPFAAGILVRHSVIPEQEGDLHTGIWLTDALQFWEFSVMVSRTNPHAPDIEACVNATASYPAIAALPGTGPSFGYLAQEVLREARAA